MTEFLEYNSNRNKLIIPEYGRHIQKMVELTVEEPDREKRNYMAHFVVEVMGNLSPHLKGEEDFQQKLWDQMFMMSDYKLDVDAPYPIPTAEEMERHPDPLGYPENNPKYRFYGHNIKKMIDQAKTWEDGPKKEGLIHTIATHMKKCYLNWNKDTVEDKVIFDHLFDLSNGAIDLNPKEEDLTSSAELVRGRSHKQHQGKPRKKKPYKGRKRN